MTVNSEPIARGLPRWAIALLVTAGALALAIGGLIVAVVVSIISEPPFGATAPADVQPGSCIAEIGVDLESYTVVDCDTAHAQQMVAEIDLGRNTEQYTTASSLASYAGEVCARFYEYGLFVTSAADDRYKLVAIAVPAPELVASGASRALCSLVAVDGSPIVGSLYRAMP